MKIIIRFFVLLLCFLSLRSYSQHNITGYFPDLSGQQVRLTGFEGFGIYTIDSTKVSEQGVFKLYYTDKNNGMGYLTVTDNTYFVMLANEDIQLKGVKLSVPESVETIKGKENQLFVQYATEHPKREQALSAWIYLQNIYQEDSLFAKQQYPKQVIEAEMQRIKQVDNGFLKNLDPDSYVSWFLPMQKLVSSVSTIAQYRTEEIPDVINAFRKLNYPDERLYKSGLLKDVIESHFWLLENMGQPLDTVFREMCISIDFLITNLLKDEKKFNEITRYLFNLLESHSLFQASEYLAIKILTQNSCTVNDDLAKQLEMYRSMKLGNTAPDIVFNGDVFINGSILKTPLRLTDIKSVYKVVIFGASWCPKCAEELAQLIPLYEKWKSKGVEVVFVSLDTDKTLFMGFTSIFPFLSICEYKKWNTKAVNDYYVFATPTLFMMDKDLKVILRPNSVGQIDAWVDFYLTKPKG